MDSQDSISFLIVQMCRMHRAYVDTLLQEVGLHVGQDAFLMCINDNEGMTQGEIAEHIGVQPATVSKVLSRMEATGMVTRSTDPADSRVTRVHLTDKSRAVRRQLDTVFTEAEARLTAGLSLEERLLMRRLLMQMQHNLSE